jgi:hypothetical protein
MADMEMDCSETEEGWFELKFFLTYFGISLQEISLIY